MTDLPRTPLTALTYDGGSLNRPDHGALIDYADGREIVTFHPACFDRAGVWRPEVLAALAALLDTSPPMPQLQPFVPNLAEWRQSGRVVADLGAWMGDDTLAGAPGRVYAACPHDPEGTGAYIEGPTGTDPMGAGVYHLTIERSEWTGRLSQLELRLFEWWMAEHCDWLPADDIDQHPYPPKRATRDNWPFWRAVPPFRVPAAEAPTYPYHGED